MKKIADIFYIVVFVALLTLVPISIIIAKDKKFSENENRYLSKKPKITLNNIVTGKFSKNFDSYIDDQFVFRENLYEIKTQVQILAGNKDINGVYLANDNYLIEKKLKQDFDEKVLQENIDSINKFAEENKEKNVQIMIVPTASLILKDKLPKNAIMYNQNQAIEEIKRGVKNATFIDLRSTLLSHKNEYIYYKTDHHWTTLGSYYAYEEWCKYKESEVDSLNYVRQCVIADFKGSLYSKILNKNVETDSIEIFKANNEPKYSVHYNFDKNITDSIYNFEKLKEKDKYQVFCGGNYPEFKIETNNDNNKNILIIKDSYANSFIPFLINDYENICVVDLRYFKENLESYIKDNQISEILILYNIENFLEDETIRFINN